MKEYVEKNLKDYGTNGDGTFECIGLTIKNKEIINKKCYRLAAFNSHSVNEALIKKNFYEQFDVLSDYINEGIVRVFGISEKIGNDDIGNRATLRIRNDFSVEKCQNIVESIIKPIDGELSEMILKIEKIIRKKIHSNKFSLEQVAFEFDSKMNLSETKAYYSLYWFKEKRDFEGNIIKQIVFQKLLKSIKSTLFIYNRKLDNLSDYTKFKCVPILFGINKLSQGTEIKFYFMFQDVKEYETYILFNKIVELFDNVIEKQEMMFDIMRENNLYVGGFAVCIDIENDEILLKPYFYPIK